MEANTRFNEYGGMLAKFATVQNKKKSKPSFNEYGGMLGKTAQSYGSTPRVQKEKEKETDQVVDNDSKSWADPRHGQKGYKPKTHVPKTNTPPNTGVTTLVHVNNLVGKRNEAARQQKFKNAKEARLKWQREQEAKRAEEDKTLQEKRKRKKAEAQPNAKATPLEQQKKTKQTKKGLSEIQILNKLSHLKTEVQRAFVKRDVEKTRKLKREINALQTRLAAIKKAKVAPLKATKDDHKQTGNMLKPSDAQQKIPVAQTPGKKSEKVRQPKDKPRVHKKTRTSSKQKAEAAKIKNMMNQLRNLFGRLPSPSISPLMGIPPTSNAVEQAHDASMHQKVMKPKAKPLMKKTTKTSSKQKSVLKAVEIKNTMKQLGNLVGALPSSPISPFPIFSTTSNTVEQVLHASMPGDQERARLLAEIGAKEAEHKGVMSDLLNQQLKLGKIQNLLLNNNSASSYSASSSSKALQANAVHVKATSYAAPKSPKDGSGIDLTGDITRRRIGELHTRASELLSEIATLKNQNELLAQKEKNRVNNREPGHTAGPNGPKKKKTDAEGHHDPRLKAAKEKLSAALRVRRKALGSVKTTEKARDKMRDYLKSQYLVTRNAQDHQSKLKAMRLVVKIARASEKADADHDAALKVLQNANTAVEIARNELQEVTHETKKRTGVRQRVKVAPPPRVLESKKQNADSQTKGVTTKGIDDLQARYAAFVSAGNAYRKADNIVTKRKEALQQTQKDLDTKIEIFTKNKSKANRRKLNIAYKRHKQATTAYTQAVMDAHTAKELLDRAMQEANKELTSVDKAKNSPNQNTTTINSSNFVFSETSQSQKPPVSNSQNETRKKLARMKKEVDEQLKQYENTIGQLTKVRDAPETRTFKVPEAPASIKSESGTVYSSTKDTCATGYVARNIVNGIPETVHINEFDDQVLILIRELTVARDELESIHKHIPDEAKKRMAQRRVRVDARGKKVRADSVKRDGAATDERLRKRKQLHRRRIIQNVFSDDDGTQIIPELRDYIRYNNARIDARPGKYMLEDNGYIRNKGKAQKTVPRIRLTPKAVRELKKIYTQQHADSDALHITKVIHHQFPRLNQGIRLNPGMGKMKPQLARGGRRAAVPEDIGGLTMVKMKNKDGRLVQLYKIITKPKEDGTFHTAPEPMTGHDVMLRIKEMIIIYAGGEADFNWSSMYAGWDSWLEHFLHELPLVHPVVQSDTTKAAIIHAKEWKRYIVSLRRGVRFTDILYTPQKSIFKDWETWQGGDLGWEHLKTRESVIGILRDIVHADERILTKHGRDEIKKEKKKLPLEITDKEYEELAAWYMKDSARDNGSAAMSPLSAVHDYIKLLRKREGVPGESARRYRAPERRPNGEERRGIKSPTSAARSNGGK